MLTHGELFAGISGFGFGFGKAGIKTLWHVEIDEACQRVLRRHYPDALLLPDVRECGAHNLPPVDIISFGSPCQDLSVAGKRAGLGGARSGLFFEAARIIRELRPTFAVWENVPGALSSHSGRDFGAVLDALADAGALDIAWRVLDLQWFRVPQRRRRIFLVCDFRARRAAQILSIPESGGWHPTPSREAGPSPAATITSGIGVTGNEPGRRREDDVNLVACLNSGGNSGGFRTEPGEHLVCAALRGNAYCDHDGDQSKLIAFNWQSGGECRLGIKEEYTDALHAGQVPAIAFQCQGSNVGEMGTLRRGNGSTTGGVPFVAHTLRSEGFDGSEDGTGRGVPIVVQGGAQQDQFCDPEGVAPTLAHSSNSHQGHHEPKVVFACSINQRREGCLRDVHGSLNGQRSATQFDGVLERMAVRRLTPLECTRLQSFPDDWLDIDGLSDSAKYRMLGNAVPPIIPEWLGRRILAASEARDAE